MNVLFYIAACIAVISTLMVIIQLNPVHALLYLVVSLLSIALIFLLLGAPFAAALEVIVYAGAIMVLFVFVVMMLNLGPQSRGEERRWLPLACGRDRCCSLRRCLPNWFMSWPEAGSRWACGRSGPKRWDWRYTALTCWGLNWLHCFF